MIPYLVEAFTTGGPLQAGAGNMAKSTAKRKLVGILTVLGLLVPGLLVALTLAPRLQAEIGPNPHASLKVVKTFDGTGHGTPGQTFVNTINGFTPGDDTSTDGVVSSQDTVGYEVSLRVEAGPAPRWPSRSPLIRGWSGRPIELASALTCPASRAPSTPPMTSASSWSPRGQRPRSPGR
ncbi:MAG: hypothetical protein R2709_10315 [Marmoricola sp.]